MAAVASRRDNFYSNPSSSLEHGESLLHREANLYYFTARPTEHGASPLHRGTSPTGASPQGQPLQPLQASSLPLQPSPSRGSSTCPTRGSSCAHSVSSSCVTYPLRKKLELTAELTKVTYPQHIHISAEELTAEQSVTYPQAELTKFDELRSSKRDGRESENAKVHEADWLCGVASSLQREVEELRRRNLALETQISTVEDPVGLSFGGLSGLSTAAASTGAHENYSHATSWFRSPPTAAASTGARENYSHATSWSRSPPAEECIAGDLRLLRKRVAKLEEEHRRLELVKMQRMARPSKGAADMAHHGVESSATVVKELDGLARQVRDAEVACQAAEQTARGKEDQLKNVRSEIEEWQRLDSAEGRRLQSETQRLREQLEDMSGERDFLGRRVRDAEESCTRSLRTASTLRSDTGILTGTRDALILEEVAIRERFGAVTRAQLQTTSALKELREAHDDVIRRERLEVQQLTLRSEEIEKDAQVAKERLLIASSTLSSSNEEVAAARQSLAELDPAHTNLQESFGPTTEARLQRLQAETEEIHSCTSAKALCRESLLRETARLQGLRAAYASQLQRLKEDTDVLTAEHARTSASCERLRVVISQMYSHAEVLALELEGERRRGDDLWKEMSAIMDATNQVQSWVKRRGYGSRGGSETNSPGADSFGKVSTTPGGGRRLMQIQT